MEPADAATAGHCTPRRGGFYLHDSTKGFSHGCIEVEGSLITGLRNYKTKRSYLILKVEYATSVTNGGTLVR
jgi:hypothetical protein